MGQSLSIIINGLVEIAFAKCVTIQLIIIESFRTYLFNLALDFFKGVILDDPAPDKLDGKLIVIPIGFDEEIPFKETLISIVECQRGQEEQMLLQSFID